MSWNDLRKGRHSQTNGEYFITYATFQRQPFFTQYDIARCFCRQLAINEKKTDSLWLAWVLMPDHFHGLVQLQGACTLSEVVKDLKGRSGSNIKRQFSVLEKCWQPAYFDRALRREEDRKAISRYIVANPLRAGLVENIGDYPYWNAVFL